MPNGRPRQPEALEMPDRQIDTGIASLSRRAEELSRSPNGRYTAEMAKLDKEKLPEQQEEGLYYLEKQLMDIIVANPKIDVKNLRLMEFIAKVQNTQNHEHAIAIQKIKEIMANPANPMAHELTAVWPTIKDEAINVRDGWGKRYMRRLKEKPLETVVYTAAGAAGVYLGLKVIKWLIGKGWEKTKDKVSSAFTPGNILAALGLSAFGAYQGKDAIAKLFGFNIGKQAIDRVKNQEIPDEVKEAAEKAKAAAEKGRQTAETAEEKIESSLQQVREETEERRALYETGGIESAIKQIEVREVDKKYSTFIEEKHPDLKVKPIIFAEIGDEIKFNDFTKSMESHDYENVAGAMRLVAGKLLKKESSDSDEIDKVIDRWAGLGARDLWSFFDTMLQKSPDEYKEFEGKTINEVMQIITDNENNYIDPQKVEKAHKNSKFKSEVLNQLSQAKPEDLENESWWTNLLSSAKAGMLSFFIDKAEKNIIWIKDNSGNIIRFQHNLAYESFIKLSNYAKESDRSPIWATGMYLHYGGSRCIAIGATLGMLGGIAKSLRSNPLALPIGMVKGSLTGMVKGAYIPLLYAAKAGKAVTWDLATGKFHPIQDVQLFAARHRFILEDLSMGRIGSNWFNMESLASKILNGTVQITDKNADRIIRTLSQYSVMTSKRIEEIEKALKSKILIHGRSALENDLSNFKKMQDELKILLQYKKEVGRGLITFDTAKWQSHISEKIIKPFQISDPELINYLNQNKRLGLIFLQENHSLAKFIKDQTQISPENAREFIKFISKNDDAFDVMARHPLMFNDSVVKSCLANPTDTKALKQAILERGKLWDKFSGKQLRFLSQISDKPELVGNFANLAEALKRADITTEAGRARLVQQKLFHDILIAGDVGGDMNKFKIIQQNPAQFKILFENTDDARKALDQFLSIDNRVLSKMAKNQGQLNEFVGLFAEYGKNETRILKIISDHEEALGIFGKASRRLNQLKMSAKAGIMSGTLEVRSAVEKGKTSALNRIKALSSRFGPTTAEMPVISQTAEVVGSTGEAIAKATRDLNAITKRIRDAEINLTLAKRSGEGVGRVRFDTTAQVKSAEDVLKKAKETKTAIEEHIKNLRKIEEFEKRIKQPGLKQSAITKIARKIEIAKETAERSSKAVAESSQAIGRLSRLSQGLKYGGRGVAVAGTGFSIWTAGSSAYEAFTTDVEGRSGIAGARAALWSADAVAGVGATAMMFGAKGASAVVGRAALPLAPITFAGEKIFETLYEGTTTEAEWAQKHSYDELIHQWFSSTNSVSLGDAWVTGFGIESIDKSMDKKVVTLRRIYSVLVTAQENPEILHVIASEQNSEAKTNKIQNLIDQNYTKYHEYYFQNERPDLIQNYESARQYVVRAHLFNEMMYAREQALASGMTEMRMEGTNLLDSKYEITGNARNPVAKHSFKPNFILNRYKENALAFIDEDAPNLQNNFEKMETPYLLRLYVQMHIVATSDPEIQRDTESQAVLAKHMALIRNYLMMRREVNLNIAVHNPEFYEPKMNVDEIARHLEGFTIKNSPIYRDYEKNNFDNNPAVYAMYKLAEMFGYHGDAKDENLKNYFSEDTASYRGIYWTGTYWYVQRRGWSKDAKMGTDLNKPTIDKMVDLLKRKPDDIIEHRHDSLFADSYDYTSQVQRMARTLENGYKAGVIKYQSAPREQRIEVAENAPEPASSVA